MKELCQDIHNSLGNQKIIESFLAEPNQENLFPILSTRTTQLNLGTGQVILHRLLHPKKINHYLLKTIYSTDLVSVH